LKVKPNPPKLRDTELATDGTIHINLDSIARNSRVFVYEVKSIITGHPVYELGLCRLVDGKTSPRASSSGLRIFIRGALFDSLC
jgi:hypothetical protein